MLLGIDHEVRFVASRPGPGAIVDVVAGVPLRTRVTRGGDREIRVRGRPAAIGALPQPDESADV
jgi:hypothetical protein